MKFVRHCGVLAVMFAAWLALPLFGDEPITDVMSPVVSYQYPEDFTSGVLTNGGLMSPVVSYQYLEWPGDDVLGLVSSLPVSYYYRSVNEFAPMIITPPHAQSVPVGANVTLSVTAVGAPPLTYQWYYNGQVILGANASTLSFSSVGTAKSGYYWVVVGSSAGSTTSAPARLTVYLPADTPQPPPPTTTLTTDPPPANLCAVPSSTGTLVVFTGGGSIDPNKMTIVLTHGFIDSSDGWPTGMASTLGAQAFGPAVNIVAWDWRTNAGKSLTEAAYRTTSEGDALGNALLTTLGLGYNHPIHFMGHSFGTMVNCRAADYIHGDVSRSPGAPSQTFAWQNTQMTLFDEAEAESLVEYLVNGGLGTGQNWRKVIPDHYAYKGIDNYISEVGMVRGEAANALLWRNAQLDVFVNHAYSYTWYSNSIIHASVDTEMGNRWSYERFSLSGVPAKGSCYVQELNSDPLTLQLTPINRIVGSLLAFPTIAAYREVSALGGSVANAVIYYGGELVTATAEWFAPPSGQPVFTGTAGSTPAYYLPPDSSSPYEAGWNFQFTLQPPVAPLLQQTKVADSMTASASASPNNSIYAWVPVSIPSNAVGMTFEFQVTGAATNEFIAIGMTVGNVTNSLFTLESKYLQDSVWTPSSVMNIAAYAGQQVELFFSSNGDGNPPSGALSVRGLQFYRFQPPVAGFTATPTNGSVPLTVTFTDISVSAVTNRYWDFGDGSTTNMTETSIAHTYLAPETNSVSLIVSGPFGSSTNAQQNLIIVTPADSVGDGIPDSWRAQYFPDVDPTGTTTNALSCATCDADGTGQNNLFKYLAGLNPTNPASVFRILSVDQQDNDLNVTWQTAGGRTNVLQSASDLAGSYSNDSPNIVLPGSGDTFTNYLDAGAATNDPARFYRIMLVP